MKGLTTILSILISISSISQEPENDVRLKDSLSSISTKPNNVQFHLLGTAVWYSFQYEREHYNKGGMVRSSVSAGLSFWPSRARWSRGTFILPLEVNLGITAPKQRWPGHYVEFGLGTSLVNHYYKLEGVRYGRATTAWFNNRIGYRCEHPKKSWLLRAAYILAWEDTPGLDFNLRNWLNVSVGWRFK